MRLSKKDLKHKAPSARSSKLTEEQKRRIYCVKHGHSRLRDFCFGYHHCARCGDLLGDSLGGAYRAEDTAVYVYHIHQATHGGAVAPGCTCRESAKALTKEDFALVPQWVGGYESRPPWRERASLDAPSKTSKSVLEES